MHCLSSLWEDSGEAFRGHFLGHPASLPPVEVKAQKAKALAGRAAHLAAVTPLQPQLLVGAGDPGPILLMMGTFPAKAPVRRSQPPLRSASLRVSVAPPRRRARGSYPQTQAQYDRIGNIWRWPTDVAGVPRADPLPLPRRRYGPGHVAPFAHVAILCESPTFGGEAVARGEPCVPIPVPHVSYTCLREGLAARTLPASPQARMR